MNTLQALTTATLIKTDCGCGTDHRYNLLISRNADASPLDLDGFLNAEARLVRKLDRATKDAENALEQDISAALEDSGLIGLLGKGRFTRALNRALNTYANTVLEDLPGIIADEQLAMADASETAGLAEWFPDTTQRSLQDVIEYEFLVRSNHMFLSRYLRDSVPQRAKAVVERVFKANIGKPYEEKLQAVRDGLWDELGAMRGMRGDYWRTLAVSALNTARSFALLTIFQSRGIETFRIKAVIDSVTTNVCLTLDGREFPVAAALDRIRQYFEARTPQDVERIKPMIQGNIRRGFWFQQTDANGQRTFTDVDLSDTEQLITLGIMFPPFHFNCRSTIEPKN